MHKHPLILVTLTHYHLSLFKPDQLSSTTFDITVRHKIITSQKIVISCMDATLHS